MCVCNNVQYIAASVMHCIIIITTKTIFLDMLCILACIHMQLRSDLCFIITNGCAAAATKSKVTHGILTNGGAAMDGAHVVHNMAYQATMHLNASAVSLHTLTVHTQRGTG